MKNDNNYKFYQYFPINIFKKLAVLGGMDTYVDLEIINERVQILNSKSILELGAGYGRVIEYLFNSY